MELLKPSTTNGNRTQEQSIAMSRVKIRTGNLLKASEQFITHQCNCLTHRSAHLSKQVFTAFPYADIYSIREKGQEDQLGTIEIRGNGEDQRYIINLLGQFYPGRTKYPNSKKDGLKAREDAFRSCLEHILEIEDMESIAFPFGVGCGAAGGDWSTYLAMIEDFADQTDAEVVIYKLPEKPKVPDMFAS